VSPFRLRSAFGIVSLLAVLTLPGGPVAAAPPAGQDCPETRAQLAGQRFTSADELPDLTCADLHGAVFDGVDLVQADLTGADAHGASFRHAHLGQAHLSRTNLRDAHFEHADLTQAQLDGADARGAFFGEASLDQADLDTADLRGADFISASLIQADLSDSDLRGAKIYWTTSIQADVSGARVNLTDPKTFQLSVFAVLIGLVLLVRSILSVVRRRDGDDVPGPSAGMLLMITAARATRPIGNGSSGGVGKGFARLLVFLCIGAFVWLLGGMLFPLLFVVVFYPALIAGGLIFLSGVVRGYRPRRPRPGATPFDPTMPSTPSTLSTPTTPTVNPWS
jgi:uncharacterized protein YjbI with pentapeptide repeats